MKKSIWKFSLQVTDLQTIKLPKDAEILSVQAQHDNPCLWALVNPDAEVEERHIETFGTGHPVYCDMGVERRFIATYQLNGGGLVFHVFERLN